jgi:DNA-directed RNA polymerase beta subunit
VLKELKEKYHIPEKAIKFINEKILNSGSEPAQKQKQLEFVLKRIEMNQKILVKQTQNCQLLPKNQEQKTKIEMKQTLQQAEESILYLYQCKNRFIHSNNTGINFAFNELQDTNLQRQDFQRASDLFDIAFVRIFNKILEIPNEVLKRQTIELFKNKDVDLHTFLNEVNLNSELNQIKQFIIDSSNAPSVSSLKVVNDGLFPSYSINDSFEEIEEEKQFFKSLRRIMENNETNKQQNPKSFVGYPQVHSL